MSNFRTAKEALYNISAFVFMMVGFLMATIILVVFNIKYVGPGRPSFVMLVIMLSGWVGLSTVFAWLAGIGDAFGVRRKVGLAQRGKWRLWHSDKSYIINGRGLIWRKKDRLE